MKHLLLPLLILFAMGFACPLSSGGVGKEVTDLLPDPQVGLDGLGNYQAVLTVTFTGSVGGQAVETTDIYTQSAWLSLEAIFTTMDWKDENNEPQYLVAGDVGKAHYTQTGRDAPCGVWWGEPAEGLSPFHLAAMLKPVGTAKSAGQETVEGIETNHYTFDGASLGLAEDVQASGEAWIAEQGNYLVKYNLQVTASASYFGEGKEGTEQVDYLLKQVEAGSEIIYPEGCDAVLTDVPAMEDAQEVIRLPGMLDYYSNSTLEAITAFYTSFFEAGDWVMVSSNQVEGERALLLFGSPDSGEIAFVSISPHSEGKWVNISIINPETDEMAPGATPGAGSDAILRVASGLTILLGMDTGQPGLSSYHMEAYHQPPAWEGGTVVHYEDRMVADVEGQNVYFKDEETSPGGSTTVSEAYLIGEEEYDVENGVLQPEGVSMVGLAWALWPLDPAAILGTAASTAQAAGTEMLEGRTAEIYTVDTSGDVGAGFGADLSITAVSGTVWIDQETGALLKAELDYTADVKDSDGVVKGSGAGRLEIFITQVGNVTVSLPEQ